MAGCTPGRGKAPAQPQALQLPPPGGHSSVPPKLGGVGSPPELGRAAFFPGSPHLGRDCRCCRLCSSMARCVLRSGATPKCFAVPLSPMTPWGQLRWGKQRLAHLRLASHPPAEPAPPPTSPGCFCAKKQSKQTKKSTGRARGCPQPPPPTGPKVSAEHLFPRSVLARPTPPHPGTRRNKKISSPSPSRPQNTPGRGEPPPPRASQGPIGAPVRAFPRCHVHP